jgi:2-keto-4-pentenoate hydratase/2-oxohepta-3-ene-1,7-dioic acid hydratase in catechol pathway
MRLGTVGIRGPLGLAARVVAEFGDSQSEGGRLIDVTAAGELWWQGQGSGDPAGWALATFPPDLARLLKGGRRGLEMAAEAVDLAARESAERLSPSGARLRYQAREVERLPLLRPPLLRDFYAFEEHVAAGAQRRGEAIPEPWYRRPVYYKGNPATLLPPGALVPWPAYTDTLDYELEVACILLSGGRDLSLEAAQQAIAGYTVFCDFSARDIQADEMQVRLGPAKSKDFASGLGPWLVTADELGDPSEMEARAYLNGELVAHSRLGQARWSFAEMVSYASGGEPLEAGEVLASGTVGGGSGQERGRFLEPGDRVECELENTGRLVHVIGPRHGGGGELVAKPPRA